MSLLQLFDDTVSSAHLLVTPVPGVLGILLGVSLLINVISIVIVVVLLIKLKAKHTTSRSASSSEHSKQKKDGRMDIEMKSNKVYVPTNEHNIVTNPNKVYGVSSTMEQHQPETYEYVTP